MHAVHSVPLGSVANTLLTQSQSAYREAGIGRGTGTDDIEYTACSQGPDHADITGQLKNKDLIPYVSWHITQLMLWYQAQNTHPLYPQKGLIM